MNWLKLFIIQLAFGFAKKIHAEYIEAVKWEDNDAANLDEFLRTDSGKKFLGLLGENANRSLQQVLKSSSPEELASVKAQAKVWNAIKTNLEVLRVTKRSPKNNKLTKDQLEELFCKMVSSSMGVTRHAMK